MYNSFVEDDDSLFSEIEDMLKGKSLQNQLRVGCFKKDVSVQTDVSELRSLQTLGENNSTLRMDMEVVKKEVAVKMKCLEAQYVTVIQREAIDLYTLMQKKSRNVEGMHKEKIALLQKSYQNQLVEAIHIINGSFKKSHAQKRHSIPGDPTDNRIVEELLTKLEEQSFEILGLTEKVTEYEEQLRNATSNAEDTGDTDTDWLKDENGRLEEENEKLNDDIDSLHIDLEQLREDLQAKENSIEDLANDLKQLTIKADEERRTLQKMTMENNQLKVQLTHERDAGKKKLNELKKEMEKEIGNIEAMRKKELLAAEETMAQHKQKQREMEKKQDALMSQKTAAAEKPTAVKDTTGSKEEANSLERMEKIVADQKTEINRLKKDLRITNATWEKKFEILRKSFHAIKDEMFLRNNLQRQSAALHFASVSYTLDMPGKKAAGNPGKQAVFTAGTPLPNIGAGTQRTDRTCASGMSSVVSSRVTDALSCIGHEVQSQHEDGDDEDFGGDLPLPLPPPPNRQIPAFAES